MKQNSDSSKVLDIIPYIKSRKLPVIHENDDLQKIIKAMVHFDQSRLLYVLDEENRLSGTISLGVLIRHVYATSYEPQVYPGFIIKLITAESAKDIMQKNPVTANVDEKLDVVLKRMIKTNTKEVPVLNSDKEVIADLKMTDLLALFLRSNEK